jgi:hypothetical protein
MSHKKPKPRLWDLLSRRVRLQLAVDFVRARADDYRRRFPEVIGIGVGYRTTRKTLEINPDQVCIRFVVQRKIAKSNRSRRHLPQYVWTSVRIDACTHRIKIPTDVCVSKSGIQHVDMRGGVKLSGNGHGINHGSVAAMVRHISSPAKRYLLTCLHVADNDMCNNSSGVRCLNASGSVIGVTDKQLSSLGLAFDAALIPVTAPNLTRLECWGHKIRKVATLKETLDILDRHQPLYLLGRSNIPPLSGRPAVLRSDKIPIVMTSWHFNDGDFSYRGTNTPVYTFCNYFQYSFPNQALGTAGISCPGDSGSAIVTEDDVLVGMHFYGAVEPTNSGIANRVLGYAFMAFSLFEDNVFSINIRLA